MIIVCGEALFDVFLDGADQTSEQVDSYMLLRAYEGGSAFNVVKGIARLGRKVAFSTEIGRDALGNRLLEDLAREGAIVDLIRQSEKPTPIAFVDTSPSGLPRYQFLNLRDVELYFDDEAISALPTKASIFHIGSYALVSKKSADRLFDSTARQSENALIAMDPNVRTAVEPNIDVWRSALERFRSVCHLIKVSSEDLEQLYGEDIDIDEFAHRSLACGCSLVIVTLGQYGAAIYSEQAGRIDVPAKTVPIADSVGAGDSFQAAVLSWLDKRNVTRPSQLAALTKEQLSEMGNFAAHVASITCSHSGAHMPPGTSLPDLLMAVDSER